MLLHSLTNGTQLHLCRNGLRCTNKSHAGSWLWAASPTVATTSASTDRRRQRPPLHQQRQRPPLRAVRQQLRPPQCERRCERSSPSSSYGRRQQAIKAKEPEVRQQVALTVSPAKATTSVVGSLTSGDNHLKTDDSGHLRTSTVPTNGSLARAHEEVFAPVLTTGVRTRPSKNAAPTRTACDVLYDLPV
jgi:hypothetical protein